MEVLDREKRASFMKGIAGSVSEAMAIFDDARDWLSTSNHGILSRITEARLKNRLAKAWDSMDDKNWLATPLVHWVSIDQSLALFQAFTVDPVDVNLSRQGSMVDKRHCLSFYRADKELAVLTSLIGGEASKLLGVVNPIVEYKTALQDQRAHVTASIWVTRSTVKSLKQGKNSIGALYESQFNKLIDDLASSLIARSFDSWPVVDSLGDSLETTLIDFCIVTSKYSVSGKIACMALDALHSTEYVRSMVKADLDRVITYCNNWNSLSSKDGLTPPVELMGIAADSIANDLKSGKTQSSGQLLANMKAIEKALQS